MIDLPRLELLVNGQEEPKNLGEEVFLRTYTKAVEGNLFFSILLDMDDTLDNLNLLEIHLLMIGYAMGQHDLESMEFELTDGKNKKLH